MADQESPGDLNGLTQPAPTTTDMKHVTIPYDEWVELKKQNERMLEAKILSAYVILKVVGGKLC